MKTWDDYIKVEDMEAWHACCVAALCSGHSREQAENCTEKSPLNCEGCPFLETVTTGGMTTKRVMGYRLRMVLNRLAEIEEDQQAVSEQEGEALMNHIFSGFTRESFSHPVQDYSREIKVLQEEKGRLARALRGLTPEQNNGQVQEVQDEEEPWELPF